MSAKVSYTLVWYHLCAGQAEAGPRTSDRRPKMAAAHPGNPPNPELVFDTLMAFQRTAALRTAIELGVFGAIGEGVNEAASLAQRCATSERGMRILCDYLTVIGFLTKENGHYGQTATTALFLDPRS